MESKVLPELRKEGGERMNNVEYDTIDEIITNNYTRGYNDGYEQGAKSAALKVSWIPVAEKIKKEIKALHDSHMIHFVSADAVVDTCLEIIDKYTSGEGANK